MAILHRRFYVHTLVASTLSAPPRGGDLLVVARDNTEQLDWELVYQSSDEWPLKQDSYDLAMDGPEGSFFGPAVLVRTDGRTHVFRGSGKLEGLSSIAFD